MLHAVRLYFASLVQVVSNVGKSVDAFRGEGPWKKRKRTPRGALKRECWRIYTSWPVDRAFQILRRLRSTPNILVFKHSPSIVDLAFLNLPRKFTVSLPPIEAQHRPTRFRASSPISFSYDDIQFSHSICPHFSPSPYAHPRFSRPSARVHSLLRTPSRSYAEPNHACVISIS